MLFQNHQRLVFIGDSITDAGRALEPPYGSGYVSLLRSYLLARFPASNLTFINKGVGGDTVRHLDKRWEQDVVSQYPNWLSVMIGINDVWRHFANNPAEAVPLGEFTDTLRRLVQRAKQAAHCGVILMTPYMIEPNRSHPMRAMMDTYGAAVGLIASEVGATLVDTQAAWDRALEAKPPSFWSADQIHPGSPGHAVLALEFLSRIDVALEPAH